MECYPALASYPATRHPNDPDQRANRPPRGVPLPATSSAKPASLAEMVGDALREHHITVDVVPVADVASLDGYDGVLLGSALYNTVWNKPAWLFVRRHHQALRELPVWLFSSGPLNDSAADHEIPPTPTVARFIRELGARGHMTFGGRLDPNPHGFMARRLAKEMAGDWRSPAHVARWVDDIAAELAPAPT